MASVVTLFIAIFVFTCIQTVVHTYRTKEECIEGIVKLMKEKRSELATVESRLSNVQTSNSLQQICEYYVPHKIHKVWAMINRDSCYTNADIPTHEKLENSIYGYYVSLLEKLATYEGSDIPNSFGQQNDYVVSATKELFYSTAQRLANTCLHKTIDEIE